MHFTSPEPALALALIGLGALLVIFLCRSLLLLAALAALLVTFGLIRALLIGLLVRAATAPHSRPP